jgi:bifunctional DNase/RNase
MTQVRCEVKGVFVAMSDANTIPVVLLTDGGHLSLPIFIGIWEAVSINSAKNKEILSRPFTHDLFLDLAAKFSITFHSLQIDSIEDGVYYAQLVLSADHHREFIDCRPSDGIALALRADIPIFVEKDVLESAGQKFSDLPPLMDLSTFLRK